MNTHTPELYANELSDPFLSVELCDRDDLLTGLVVRKRILTANEMNISTFDIWSNSRYMRNEHIFRKELSETERS